MVNKRPVVAFVCPRLAVDSVVGGAEKLIRNLAQRLTLYDFEVEFLTTCAVDHYTWRNELPSGIKYDGAVKVHYFPVTDRDVDMYISIDSRISRGFKVSIELQKLWLANSVNSTSLIKHLSDNIDKYNVIITGPYLFGLTYSTVMVCPNKTIIIPCLHDEPYARLDILKEMFEKVKAIIFNSESERNLYERIFSYTIGNKLMAIVGTGVDDFNASPDFFVSKHGIVKPYILYCGRREPLKGTPLLIAYFRAFLKRTAIDLQLVLTGTGKPQIPADMKSYILDTGVLSEEEKRSAMAGALVFCNPSLKESLGIVILESWVAGVPVLVHGDCEVLVSHCKRSNGGLWFRCYPEFEEALTLLIKDTTLAKRLGMNGREYVMKYYSWKEIDTRLLNIINQVMKANRE